MKNKTFPMMIFFALILLNTHVVKAEALSDDACPKSPKFYQTDTMKEIDPISGVEVSVNTYVGAVGDKKNVVVFGQDPEEEGVGVTVILNPVVGDIVHNEWITSCKYYGLYPDDSRKDLDGTGECCQAGRNPAFRRTDRRGFRCGNTEDGGGFLRFHTSPAAI
jgi:hypothetical protein